MFIWVALVGEEAVQNGYEKQWKMGIDWNPTSTLKDKAKGEFFISVLNTLSSTSFSEHISTVDVLKRGPGILVFKLISWLKKTEMEFEGPNLGKKLPAG